MLEYVRRLLLAQTRLAAQFDTAPQPEIREVTLQMEKKEQNSPEEDAPGQPAMDLSRDKNAEEMKWSPLEMGAAKQAHGA